MKRPKLNFTGIIDGWLEGDREVHRKQRNDATTEQERIAAEVDIARIEERQAMRALGGKLTAIVQAAWAAPFIVYTAKLLVWDKLLWLGATDSLCQSLMVTQITIVTFFFGGAAAIGVVRAIKR
ncbi:hypothetical protein [Maritimibacter sp. HL-12]|uniref:hypothetical protein n=1 Tax=Maritimibacter sp. HL-12 TaxID=1162418 RepID=UPI000A1CBEE9|nr:hypothetical protein [Maritimibacter sp. HL-12]